MTLCKSKQRHRLKLLKDVKLVSTDLPMELTTNGKLSRMLTVLPQNLKMLDSQLMPLLFIGNHTSKINLI
jgi:hypothetical protein